MQPVALTDALVATRRAWAALFGPGAPVGCACHDDEQSRRQVVAQALAGDLRSSPHLGLSEADEIDRHAVAVASVREMREIEGVR